MISFVGREGGGSGPSISEWVRPNHHQSGLISSLSFLFHFRTFVCVAGRVAFSLTFVRLSGPASRLPSFLLHSLPRGCGCWLCPSQRDLLSDNNTHATHSHSPTLHPLPPTCRLTHAETHEGHSSFSHTLRELLRGGWRACCTASAAGAVALSLLP